MPARCIFPFGLLKSEAFEIILQVQRIFFLKSYVIVSRQPPEIIERKASSDTSRRPQVFLILPVLPLRGISSLNIAGAHCVFAQLGVS